MPTKVLVAIVTALAVVAAVAVVIAVRSTGGSAPEATPTGNGSGPGCTTHAGWKAGTSTTHTIEYAGTKRTYYVHVPAKYDPRTKTPAVFYFHGLGQDAGSSAVNNKMQAMSDQFGFLLVALQGKGTSKYFDFITPATKKGSDLALVHRLVTTVDSNLCVDPDQRFAAGFSIGSAMTFALACEGSPDFAAYGGVSATFWASQCSSAPKTSIIYFHGKDDKTVPFNGAKTAQLGTLPSVAFSLNGWAVHDGCSTKPTVTQAGAKVARYVWTGCTDSDIHAYEIEDGGHQWPGGNPAAAATVNGFQTQAVDAALLIWQFFAQHPKA